MHLIKLWTSEAGSVHLGVSLYCTQGKSREKKLFNRVTPVRETSPARQRHRAVSSRKNNRDRSQFLWNQTDTKNLDTSGTEEKH